MTQSIRSAKWRTALLTLAITPSLILLGGCGGGSGKKSNNRPDASASEDQKSGAFINTPVSGLDVNGTTTSTRTGEQGAFTYSEDETLTFAIGDLILGSSPGSENVTVLSITENATDPAEAIVHNKLILLQSLDEDGDLNNGIHISDTIRETVSSQANMINFDLPVEDFRTSLLPLITDLENLDAFTDTDPRARAIRKATPALDYYKRANSERHEVSTSEGAVRGYAPNENTWQYLGIPYAQPPLGELRWRPPVALTPREQPRDAVAWADQSAQDPTMESINEGGMSEDSLYLNITAPKNAVNLPVMVWFHGGSFAIFSANSMQYNNPDSLTTKDVVLVTVNHRLGPFGYIAHPLLTVESDYNGSGNYGQMDLVMALQWIKNNIKLFGGNPDNVTLFGQSGGGAKTYSLMNSPQATGLFHKAIVQSGFSPLDMDSTAQDTLDTSEAIGVALFERTGVTTLEEARALPWTAFVEADLANNIPRQTYRPNADFYYQPKTYYQNVQDGLPSDVPMMTGVTSGDYDSLRAALPVWLSQRTPLYQSSQFVYKFSQVPAGWQAIGIKSCHGCELPYLFNYPGGQVQNYNLGLVLTPEGEKPAFGDLNGNGLSGINGDAEDVFLSMQYGNNDKTMVEKTMTAWTNFAKTGNPSSDDFRWPAYSIESDVFVEFGPNTELTIQSGLTESLQ